MTAVSNLIGCQFGPQPLPVNLVHLVYHLAVVVVYYLVVDHLRSLHQLQRRVVLWGRVVVRGGPGEGVQV